MSNNKSQTTGAKPTRRRRTQKTDNKPAIETEPESVSVLESEVASRSRVEVETVINVLIEIAKNTRENAYAPYSGYRVGAALLTLDGTVYGGCNVENAAYGMSICAERTAVVKAISEGVREFEAIAVVTENAGTPCGACRQFLSEFGSDIMVILADTSGNYTLATVGELLPHAFQLKET
jgi:cytidine deaminase